ncbi:MAG: ABC transporter permease [Oscillospiraceae bacterium]|nr:ABC transporter permease [Oscillospiraceae bacterium]
MFFRMLKKDLKESRGLNIILILFMVIAATLASAGTLLVFTDTHGVAVSRERCNAADGCIVYEPMEGEIGKAPERLIRKIRQCVPDAEIAWQELIPVNTSNLDFDCRDMVRMRSMSHSMYLSTVPEEQDLVYAEDDSPFYLESGQIAVTRQFARNTGIQLGDALRITTQMGRQYEFTVAVIAKDPTKEWQTRFFVSDPDYALFCKENPHRRILVSIRDPFLHTDSFFEGVDPLYALSDKLYEDPVIKEHLRDLSADCHIVSNYALISMLIAAFLVIAVFFMLIIISFTLRFSIRSAVKKEERELGIMKALGTDSVSFRWLFAAKYITFAMIGGTVGFFAGIAAGKFLIGQFFYKLSYTISVWEMLPSLLAAVMITAIVILFIFLALRRIDKIHVIDVITGENRSESVKHAGRFRLTRRKKMSVPLFLAISDILAKFRRYVLPVIAFTAGSLLVMFSIQLRETVISTEFLKSYYTVTDADFGLDLSKDLRNRMSMNTGRLDLVERNINKEFEKAGIPAELDIAMMSYSSFITDRGTVSGQLVYDTHPERMRILDGGQVPQLKNEVLMDRYTAESLGCGIGDTIRVKYDKYSEDGLSASSQTEEFVITGFVDRLAAMNNTEVITSAEFSGAVLTGYCAAGFRIDAPESEKAGYAAKIAELFPDESIAPIRVGGDFLAGYDILFSFVRDAMVVIVAFVLIFLSVMYQTIFMKEEENEAAMLKSCGIEDGSVKRWQFLRMMILFVGSQILAAVLMPTAVTWGCTSLFRGIVGLTSWRFTGSALPCVIWCAAITVLMAAAEWIVLRGVDKIEIWRIRNE